MSTDLTARQKGALIRLANTPLFGRRLPGKLPQVTGQALVRRGYALQVVDQLYELTDAGRRFVDTGEQIERI